MKIIELDKYRKNKKPELNLNHIDISNIPGYDKEIENLLMRMQKLKITIWEMNEKMRESRDDRH